jgi:pimeloyl-ACP methyl ester carboxylesterase
VGSPESAWRSRSRPNCGLCAPLAWLAWRAVFPAEVTPRWLWRAAGLRELIERTCPSPPALVGHGLGGAIAARFAAGHGDRVSRLVLADSFGLGRYRPAPRFAFAMIGVMVRQTDRTQERLFRQCMADLDGYREQVGERAALLEAYALDRARSPGQKAWLRSLMPQFGLRLIPPAELARIAVPTTLIWGRHDQQVRLGVAQAASARYGWPLRVIQDAADDPAAERPEAFLRALSAAPAPSRQAPGGSDEPASH